LVEQYDGSSWIITTSPNPSTQNQNTLLGVACVSTNDCWTAGSNAVGNVQQALVEHYNGTSWVTATSANTDTGQSNFPRSIACNSTSDCWAVGFYFAYPSGNVLTLVDHYNGLNWDVVPSPNPPPNLADQYTDFLTRVSCASSVECWAVGYYFNVNGATQTLIEHYAVPPVQLSAVASRKTHGSAGAFDVELTGGNGIECRSGGADGAYTLVLTFANPLLSVSDATVTDGTGSVVTSNIDSNDAHRYLVNLSGITNAQNITVTLNNVTDTANNFSSTVTASMKVLVGDTNADGFVNSADIGQTKSQSGVGVTNSNFREDVNVDGFVNSADIGLVKSKSGTALP
jgi:hypothetical protein